MNAYQWVDHIVVCMALFNELSVEKYR